MNRAYLITNRNEIEMISELAGNYTNADGYTQGNLWIVGANLENQETISKNIL